MWPWLLSLVILTSTHPISALADIPASSVGPADPKEASLLWNQAEAAFQAGQCRDALVPLQRLVDRHPSQPHYTDAHQLLGLCFLELNEPRKAIGPLQFYISARGKTEAGLRARTKLAEAQLLLKKFHAAALSAAEILSPKIVPPIPEDLKTEALLLKTEALIGLNRDSEAEKTKDSAEKSLSVFPPTFPRLPYLTGKTALVALQLKTRACARFPSSRRLREEQAHDQIERRGTCLLDAALTLKKAWAAGSSKEGQQSARVFSAAFKDYFKACANPPLPPGKRTDAQKKQYRLELAQLLEQGCKAKRDQVVSFLDEWKSSLPGPTAIQAEQTISDLKKL